MESIHVLGFEFGREFLSKYEENPFLFSEFGREFREEK